MTFQVATIGVYGFKEADFFYALEKAAIDVFCDLRLRRGLRGSEYAFANSGRLQKRLAEINIRYVHLKYLAPNQIIRDLQKRDDKEYGVAKRTRLGLGEDFISAYKQAYLSDFDSQFFLNQVGENVQKIVLFCVEREPLACHRSLVAEQLAHDFGISVEHLKP